jgi:LysR family transcriptional regulator, low CO2-responsive transcriptional regulator
VGLPLYEVIARRVHLTDAGRELAATIRVMADQWDAYEQRVAAQKGLTRGRLRVAVVSTAKYFIPRLLGQFCERYPNIDLSLEVLNRDHVVARLRANQDDLYVMSRPPSDLALVDEILMPNPLVVIAPPGHRLAGHAPVPLSDLKNERFVLRERGSGTRMYTEQAFSAANFVPDTVLELGSNEAIRESVAGHLGVAVLSRHALAGSVAQGLVVELDVSGFPVESMWHLVWPQGRQLSPVATVFREHLKRELVGPATDVAGHGQPGPK